MANSIQSKRENVQRKAFFKWRAEWVKSYKLQKQMLEGQMRQLLLEKAKRTLYQKYQRQCRQRTANSFQKWKSYALVVKIDQTQNKMRGLIDTKTHEINKLKSTRIVDTVLKIQLRQKRQAIKMMLDYSVENRISNLVKYHQDDNIKMLNRVQGSYRLYDLLNRKLYQHSKPFFANLMAQSNNKASPKMKKKVEVENMLRSTSSKKKGASTNSNMCQIHELSKEFSSGGKRDKNQGINGSSCTSNKEGDNIYFPNLNSGYGGAGSSSGALMRKFEWTGPTVGKLSSEEECVYQETGGSKRNELLQSGTVLMQSLNYMQT